MSAPACVILPQVFVRRLVLHSVRVWRFACGERPMAIPNYEGFFEPLLRLLHERPEGVRTAEAYAELAKRASLTEPEREQLLPSGVQPVYENRISWAHYHLKRFGLSSSPRRGLWQITDAGKSFVARHQEHFTLDTVQAEFSLVGGDVPNPTLRIGMLPAATRSVLPVKRDTPLREAITLMLLRDFSQLPVMQNERTVNGVVSWKTIGRRLVLKGPCDTVRECMDENVTLVRDDQPLFDVLDTIIQHDFVLVTDGQRRVSGIVTMSDVGEEFRDISEPYLLLGAIENQIRRLIAGKFSLETLRAVRSPDDTGRKIDGLFDLTFAEYASLLGKEENWKKLNLPVDRRTFITALDRVRQVRNDVMHFDPTLEEEAVRELRDFARLLRTITPDEPSPA
jgi:CBS domain-containing protein